MLLVARAFGLFPVRFLLRPTTLCFGSRRNCAILGDFGSFGIALVFLADQF